MDNTRCRVPYLNSSQNAFLLQASDKIDEEREARAVRLRREAACLSIHFTFDTRPRHLRKHQYALFRLLPLLVQFHRHNVHHRLIQQLNRQQGLRKLLQFKKAEPNEPAK
ncbi:hypothetical protein BLNAU_10778 [Blattamonas nauphoetae]|uniref:Uncharacterized protein n=1 Tax=Blattamonas nauphoetae TaxID=2049346 RepID=A0ABQ9XSJ8_9EUKA|nr:hypothetical protein BLNAU_10778 [Blattamonas nauphoetae]